MMTAMFHKFRATVLAALRIVLVPFVLLVGLARKVRLQDSTKAMELFVATVALGIAVWSNLKSNAVQERLARGQMNLQANADIKQHSDSLLAIISNSVQLIDLDTNSGRAALTICLNAALALNEKPGNRFDYRRLLPRYSEERLVESLADKDPDLLKAMLAYALKPAQVATPGELFYVVVGTYVHPDREVMDSVRHRLRSELNASPLLRDLPISVLNRVGKAESFAMVVGSRFRLADADDVIGAMKRSSSSFRPYRISAESLAR